MSKTDTPKNTRARRQAVRLTYADGQVVVTPQDRSLFCISAERAVRACQRAVREQEFQTEFEESVIIPLRDWCSARETQVGACYLPPPEANGLPVYIVGRAEQYDFDLARDVADLAVMFADRGWSVDPHLVPTCSADDLAAMFDLEQSLQVYGG